jgi:hypothetical protein
MIEKTVDLGEYKVVIEYDDDSGSGYINVTILDELGGIIESLEVDNFTDNDQ